ncbi:class IV lanthionine synthetase LanL [Streptosporangium sp. NPDC051022]|uniref:class IV lanthionine synthetase LanL n=1 Tax=Streptosporangium sp. NPDC051022 TaxID=3155752 RepID=UPI00343C57A9
MSADGREIRPTATEMEWTMQEERDDARLRDMARNTLGNGWTAVDGEYWHEMRPQDLVGRVQGWKIHLSAIPDTAEEVLRRTLDVLGSERCAFKFVRSVGDLRSSLSRAFEKSASGKFITIYPADEDRFLALVGLLDDATSHLPGPRIQSDRRLSPSSLVHYRYGGFTPIRRLTDMGGEQDMLVTPSGDLVVDERVPYFAPPAWAVNPLPSPTRKAATDSGSTPRDPRLNGRYVVVEAIRHTNRGGIYRALDTVDDSRVIIKQARPYIDVSAVGDAQDLLRNEAAILTRLHATGLTALLVDQFAVGEDLFVVQQELPGKSVEDWVLSGSLRGRSLDPSDVLACCRNLVDLVARVHAEGIVIQDLTPSNVLRSEDGALMLIDLEAAGPVGEITSALTTPSYRAPEREVTGGEMPSASTGADLYSLGAVICFLALEQEPYLFPDEKSERENTERLGAWLSVAARDGMVLAEALSPLILGLMDADPGGRWSLERASRFLADLRGGCHRAPDASPAPEGLDAAVRGTLMYLIDEQRPHATEMWPVGAPGGGLYPASVMYGASGVAAALLRAHSLEEKGLIALSGDTSRNELAKAVEAANRWYDLRLSRRGRRILPGLYAGHAGLAWTAFDLATAVGDEVNQCRAVELAKALPVSWHNPDVYHGLAGAGLALLHLWRATGDEQLGQRARLCADSIVDAAIVREGRTYWPLPAGRAAAHGPTSKSAIYQGFAHGTAGVGTFLLLSAREWGDSRHLEFALKAGDSLTGNVTKETDWNGQPLESAWWDADPTTPGERHASWCHGSAGIGGFLLRLWQHSGDTRHRVLAEQAGAAVRMSARHSGGGACHGLTGAGHFLLDLADALDDPRYREWSVDVAEWLTVRHAHIEQMPVAGIEPLDPKTKSLDFASGSAGDLDFLLRLRFGGRAPWMPPLETPADRALRFRDSRRP